MPKNVLGTELKSCSYNPMTGVFRDGFCTYSKQDPGLHIMAAQVTQGFLEWNKARGNDLITPKPEWEFTGLKDGDWWCICLGVWLQSKRAGFPLYLNLKACPEKVLDYIAIDELKSWDYQLQNQ
jgi:hypothetical protein